MLHMLRIRSTFPLLVDKDLADVGAVIVLLGPVDMEGVPYHPCMV